MAKACLTMSDRKFPVPFRADAKGAEPGTEKRIAVAVVFLVFCEPIICVKSYAVNSIKYRLVAKIPGKRAVRQGS